MAGRVSGAGLELSRREIPITADLVLRAYAIGVFPMAENRHDKRLFWVDPERRGVIPLRGFHVPSRLRRTFRSGRFEIAVDRAFRQTIEACAEARPMRRSTWISERIVELYDELHQRGFAHSVETWRDGRLVGGLYGVTLGAAFFGESMFSREADASKVALVHLVGRLVLGGFRLLDTQFVTEHLAQFGAVEVDRADYKRMLEEALALQGDFYCGGRELSAEAVLQSITQTS
jgi:leucyl/phenylalanyl-tRNA---protein transferase